VGISKVARDITDRRRAERHQKALYELVASVNRSAALPDVFDAALQAICVCQQAERASVLLRDSDGVMRFRAWRGLWKATGAQWKATLPGALKRPTLGRSVWTR
jgi:GAF domain-containing protein